jgi:hypothetical protein
MKIAWAKIKLWCFHNWRILVIVGAIVLAYALGGKKVKALQTQLQMARELYKKEVDAIEGASQKKTEMQTHANIKYQARHRDCKQNCHGVRRSTPIDKSGESPKSS